MTSIYPTASTVAIFLNGYHVDEAFRIDYRESFNKVPIYGYNDFEYKKVAHSRKLIQGLLVLNFTYPGYLTTVLNSRSDAYVPTLYNYQVGTQTVSNSLESQRRLYKELSTELPPNSDEASREARAQYIASLISRKKSKEEVSNTKEALRKFFDESAEDPFELRGDRPDLNPLDIESKSKTGNQIDVYYQDPKYVTWFVRFHNVHFNEISQQINQAGADGSSEPLYEVMQFIASKRQPRVITNE